MTAEAVAADHGTRLHDAALPDVAIVKEADVRMEDGIVADLRVATYTAAAEKMDSALEEAAKTLGASRYAILRDVWIPELAPTTLACAAIVFATSMGAFGTAFTLATKFEVLPITIYSEFTNYANFALAASLSIALGLVTWSVMYVARRYSQSATVLL